VLAETVREFIHRVIHSFIRLYLLNNYNNIQQKATRTELDEN